MSTMRGSATGGPAARSSAGASGNGVSRAGGTRAAIAPSDPTDSGISPAAHSCTSGASLGHQPRLAHRVRRADGRVAGERQLGARREDAQAIVGAARDGSTNVVSDRLVQAAMRAISASARPWASRITATGLPANGRAVKTSTCLKRTVRMREPSSNSGQMGFTFPRLAGACRSAGRPAPARRPPGWRALAVRGAEAPSASAITGTSTET